MMSDTTTGPATQSGSDGTRHPGSPSRPSRTGMWILISCWLGLPPTLGMLATNALAGLVVLGLLAGLVAGTISMAHPRPTNRPASRWPAWAALVLTGLVVVGGVLLLLDGQSWIGFWGALVCWPPLWALTTQGSREARLLGAPATERAARIAFAALTVAPVGLLF